MNPAPGAQPAPTDRAALLARLAATPRWDLAIVGGGATGLCVALDAATRGLTVLLADAGDLAGGTSSRATKLLHGGVRYLAQGHLPLVREALRERGAWLRNAPHLARPLPFVVPAWRWWQRPFYGAGLMAYSVLAGSRGLGATRWLDAVQTRAALPGVREAGLRGGILYWDGQFDDARLALALARTAAAHGALIVNHCEVTGLRHDAGGRLAGLRLRDAETGRTYEAMAGCVVNAAGVWVDRLRADSAAARGRPPRPLVQPSQGVHLVVDRDFMPSDHALLVPRTEDGRVLFVVPWLGKLILGTTDTPRADAPREPRPLDGEVEFILRESARVLARPPTWADVRSAWAGLRPLVRPDHDAESSETKHASREHWIEVAADGLVSVTGGKWTTARAMAEDVLNRAHAHRLLPPLPPPVTDRLPLVGAPAAGGAAADHDGADLPPLSAAPGSHLYGSDAWVLAGLPGADRWLADGLSEAMVRFAVRHEWARSVEDVLARRSRLLLLDARRAAAVAPVVAAILREEGVADPRETDFAALATRYAQPL